jgi:Tol biopolymer transport system component
MLQLKRVSEIKLSPDGKYVLYNLGTPKLEENKVVKDLFLVSVDGRQTIQLTNDQFSENGAVFSPNGKQIAFISNIDKVPQVQVMDLATKKYHPISVVPEGVDNILWSPDGKYISFTSKVKIKQTVQELNPRYSKAKVRIYDKLPIRAWDEWIDETVSHLFIMPSDGGNGTFTDLMQGQVFETPLRPLGGVEQIAWSPDGNEIAYTSKQVDNPAFSTNSDIYVLNLKTKKVINITEGMLGYDKDPLYSPDGRWIAFHSQERPGFESDRVRLMLYNREDGTMFELSKTLDQWVGDMVWANDSKSLFFTAEDGPTVQI